MRSLTTQKNNSIAGDYPSLIGRQNEIAEIHTLLLSEECRLLTVTGPGGIGKTALAAHAAEALIDHFQHGFYFVPLQPIQDSKLIPTAIRDGAGITFSGTEEPLFQVCKHFEDKNVLLVLDNFEHLLDGVGCVTALLDAAPALKLLVTSREALNLRDEWLYPLLGLTYPQRTTSNLPPKLDQQLDRYNAVQLFVERATRLRRDLVLAEEGDDIAQICQLVEGMPLALELAASWTKSLRCADIANEIQQNLNFLTTRLRDVPDRHRSIQAVFEHSWQLLTEREQNVFMRLCVFRGGFTLEAATEIAAASLELLASLVDKSLVYQNSDHRYSVHELLRQFAQSKLEESPHDLLQTGERHCVYYTDYLYARQSDVTGSRQHEAIAEIENELDNVRGAVQWAIEHNRFSAMIRAIQTISQFSQYRSCYQESTAVLEKMLASFERGEACAGAETSKQAQTKMAGEHQIPEQEIGLLLTTVYLGWTYIRMGKIEEAETLVQRCRALYAERAIAPLPGSATDPDAALGVICLIKGDYARAAELGETSIRRNTPPGNLRNLQLANYVLTHAVLAQGHYVQAQHYAQEMYTFAHEIGDQWFFAYCYNVFGQVEEALGNYTTAIQHFQASYQLRAKFNDLGGMAVALAHLGQIALLQNNFTEAQEFYSKGQELYEYSNDRGGLATVLDGLGAASYGLGDDLTACQYLRRALQLAAELQFVPVIFSVFLHSSELFLKTGLIEQGLSLLTFVLRHPTGAPPVKQRATLILSNSGYGDRSVHALDGATDLPAPHDTLGACIDQLLYDLAIVENSIRQIPVESEPPRLPAHQTPAQPSLIEPLTQREIEVLTLLAQGLTNQQIAQQMIVSLGTVKAHNHNIFSKLGVTNRSQAVARAREIELL